MSAQLQLNKSTAQGVAIPHARRVNSSMYLQSATAFSRNSALVFPKKSSDVNDESNQRSALFANERRSVVPRQEGRIGNRRSLAQRACVSPLQRFNAATPKAFASSALQPNAGFTLLELLIVLAITGLLLVLIAPMFTSIKGGTDVTSAAYTIKGVLDTARTYAKANNTYVWVGFYEEDVSAPSPVQAPDPRCTGCVGRVVMSIVASKNGTNLGADASSSLTGTENFIDATQLVQVNKLIKIDNLHLPLFALGTGTGDTFDARPSPTPASDAPFSRFGELNALPPNTAPYEATNGGLTKFPFQYPVGNPVPTWQYRFRRTLRFSPTGECRVNSTYDVRKTVEAGLLQTHGTTTPPPRSGGGTTFVTWDGNVAAVQITGFGGNVNIYRR